jgi:phage-related baseplate assembly protein
MSNNLVFVETDAEALYNSAVTELQRLTGESMYPGDERMIHAGALVTIIVSLFNTVNERCKGRMLRFASGTVLDALGEFRRCARLASKPATTTERFTIAEPRAASVQIPAGTRVSDGGIVFATKAAAAIQIGALSADVEVESVEGGTDKNGVPVGAVTTLIDAIPYVTGVTNLTVSANGDDGEPYPESDGGAGDERYRERIRLANSAYTTAGCEDGYVYWAKTANATIEDVRVLSEQTAGTVDIYVTTKGGEIPSQAVLDDVLAICSAKTVRPMNDLVTVHAPTVVPFGVVINYTVKDGDQVRAAADITAGVEAFVAWQKSKIGRNINPDKLKKLIMTASDGSAEGGVYACSIVQPTAVEVASGGLAVWNGSITVNAPTVLFGE